jgi:hypothetical protein
MDRADGEHGTGDDQPEQAFEDQGDRAQRTRAPKDPAIGNSP